MTPQEIQTLLEELGAEKNQAFLGDSPNVLAVQGIISKLKNVPNASKPSFKLFAQELKNALFDSGANIPGIDLSSFDNITEEVPPVEILEVRADIESKTPIDALKEVVECLEEDLPTLKNYFYLKLSSSTANFRHVLIFEDGCFYQPIKRRFIDKYGDCLCLSVEDFKLRLEQGDFADESFIALLVVSTKVNENDKIDKREAALKDIFNYFEEVSHLLPKKKSITSLNDFISSTDTDSLLDEIRYVTSSFLSNSELTNDEEKIIKKLFKDTNVPILEYKVLKGGKSGSKVVEIRPKKNYATSQTRRFIVKFSQYDDKKKIYLEAKRFGDHIEHYSVPNYSKVYEKNATTEAIKYTYASRDNIANAYSFSEIIDGNQNEFYEQRKDVIEETFASEPFALWQQSMEKVKVKIGDLYAEYINSNKFFANVCKIKGITESQLLSENIYTVFNRIFELDLDIAIKVCHGDFHTENFFKDSNGTYLIDFGFTEKRHAIIDHTTLECSLKFKHVPFYVDLKDLENIEQQLLSDDSFNATFDLKSPRGDIKDYYELVKAVRLNSLKYFRNENDKLEYLISLFILTCRNAQYSDLNQSYALKSAEILGAKIVQLLI